MLLDWLNLFLRWAHVVIGIGWIGASFHFVWLDRSLRRRADLAPGVEGDSWMVHGGGFYHAVKYKVAPEGLPPELHWFKHEAYFTWVTGFLLLVLVYYAGAESFLIDRAKADLSVSDAVVLSLATLAGGWIAYDRLCRSPLGRNTELLAVLVFALAVFAAWFYGRVFSGRAAFLHVGALLGTMMSANVFFVIIPNQRRVVAALLAGEAPDPALGAAARQRSLHNNYLTLPVVLMMIGNHYPMAFGQADAWLAVAGFVAAGAMIRQFMNQHDGGRPVREIAWLLPATAVVLAGVVALAWPRRPSPESVAALTEAQMLGVVQQRCTVCHARVPSQPGFAAPPAGLVLEAPAEIRAAAARIRAQAIDSHAMPLGNVTGMTDAERAGLGGWLADRR
jgi:uncharacterized membrane protein